MSVKHSLFINRVAPAVMALCLPLVVSAQKYDRLLKRNLWNDGSNIASLRIDTLSFSEASLSVSAESGDFRSSDQSASEFGGAVLARSVSHLKGFSMTGSFGFSDTEALGMCGSMFVEPGYFPVDVSEFTPGRKSLQRYLVSGGIAVPLSSSWLVGASLDFKSTNASKRKDLRYTGYKLDLEFAPSILYMSDKFSAGLSLSAGRNTEIINAEQIGTSDTTPMAFFNEGLWFGNYQAWTGSSVHLKEAGVNGLPVYKNTLGAAAQLSSGGLFAEAGVTFSHGEVGERQNIWYRFGGPEYFLTLDYRTGRHTIRTSASYESGEVSKSILDKVTSGGVVLVKEYGSNRILESGILNAGISYEWTDGETEVGVCASLSDRRDVGSMRYPYVFGREIVRGEAGAYAVVPIGKWEIRCDAGFGMGHARNSSWSVSDGGSDVEPPFRHEELYAVAEEYATVPRMDAAAGVARYFGKGLFAALRGSAVKAFSPVVISGSWRYGVGIEFGLTF